MILYNQLNISFNKSSIKDNFTIYQFQSSSILKRSPYFLDQILEKGTALATVFEPNSSSFYTLFSKINEAYKFKLQLKEFEEVNGFSYLEVDVDYIPEYQLAQLLINSIGNPKLKARQFNNITGALYLINPSSFVIKSNSQSSYIKQIPSIKFGISKDGFLTIKVTTFTNTKEKKHLKFDKKRFEEYSKYELVAATNTMRRVKEEVSNNTFIIKQFSGKKNNVDFLDFSNYDRFINTKVGIIYNFLILVNKKLKEYISLEFKEFVPSQTVSFVENPYSSSTNFTTQIKHNKFNIIDLVNTLVSQETLKEIKAFLVANYGVKITQTDKPDVSTLNFVLIHNKDYFKDCPLEDQYGLYNRKNHIIQHITYEDLFQNNKSVLSSRKSDGKSSIINVLIKELLIKHDIKRNIISIVDWSAFKFSHKWIFGLKKDNKIYFMEIESNGNFKFRILDSFHNIFDNSEYQSYINLMLLGNNGKENHRIEGFIKAPSGAINFIEKTDSFTIPNIISIGSRLEEEAKEEYINLNQITNALKEALNLYPQYEDAIVSLQNNLTYSQQFSKRELINLFSNRLLLKIFSEILYNQTGIRLKNYFRDSLNKYEVLGSQLSINYREIIDKQEALFFVGSKDKAIGTTFNRAATIRKVVASEGSTLFFNELLPLMNVDFVRNEELTVLPFPFKYIREFINIEGTNIPSKKAVS
jgi:hypothetical protein